MLWVWNKYYDGAFEGDFDLVDDWNVYRYMQNRSDSLIIIFSTRLVIARASRLPME